MILLLNRKKIVFQENPIILFLKICLYDYVLKSLLLKYCVNIYIYQYYIENFYYIEKILLIKVKIKHI